MWALGILVGVVAAGPAVGRPSDDGFEFCPEITAKFLRKGLRIHESPIAYYPRSFEEGKKINWRDGIKAVWTLLRFRWWRP